MIQYDNAETRTVVNTHLHGNFGLKTVSPGRIMDQTIRTTCGICQIGCGVLATVTDGQLTRVTGDADHPLNKGAFCPKGLASFEYLYHPQRIRQPMKRLAKRGEGKITQKAVSDPTINPGITWVDYGWLNPEASESNLFGWQDSNVNILIDYGVQAGKERWKPLNLEVFPARFFHPHSPCKVA